jgi:PAS domain S-box-containing protein
LKEALRGLPSGDESFDDVEVVGDFDGIGRRTMRLNARMINPDLGPGSHTILSIEDVTERILAEKALRDSETRFRRLFEAAQDGILILDAATGRIEQANPHLAHLLGHEVPDLLGRELWEFGFFRDREEYLGVIRQLRHAGYVRFEDLPLKTRGGREIEVEFVCNVYPVGERGMAQCNIRDVSERKRAERTLRQAELKLRQSLKMEAVAKLAGGVAHEYNNLLTAINGYAAISLSQPDPEGRFHPNLSEILKAGQRAAVLTRQLLAYSQQQVLAPRLVDPNAILANVRDLVRELVGKKIHLDMDLDPDVGLVLADPDQIEQVLLNLAMNARNAMPQGGRLTMRTSRAAADPESHAAPPGAARNDQALFTISDTGVGMDEEVQSRIFDPFYTTKALPGTPGLGLSMVQGIIAQSGGRVITESAPGRGSTFKVFLPIAGESAVRKP